MAVGHEGSEKFAIMGDLLGRLHTLPSDGSVSRPGGASGDDPRSEGSPRQTCWQRLHSSMRSMGRSLRQSASGSSSSATNYARLTAARGCQRRSTATSCMPRIT